MKDTIKTTTGNAGHLGENHPPRIVTVDYEKYAHFLEESDLTEDQKQEFLQAVWGIICEFVSLGFGVHPVQQALEAQKSSGKPPESGRKPAERDKHAVQWLDIDFIEQFTAATGLEEDRDGKEVEDGQV